DQLDVLAGDQDPIVEASIFDEAPQRGGHRRLDLLDLDVDADGGIELEDLGEGRDRDALAAKRVAATVGGEVVAGVESAQLGEGQLPDPPAAVGGAAQLVIVEGHDLAV